MILEIDMGNSRIKWRLRGESGKVAGGSGATDADARGAGPWPLARWDWLAAAVASEPEQVWVSSVLSDAYNQAFARWVDSLWHKKPRFARVRQQCAGVRNGYRQPFRLGVDRWLAMLAAYQRGAGPCLVANCGTALTLDLIDDSGQHLGGYIGPGLGLMRESLGGATLALAAGAGVSDSAGSLAPGRDSAACVSAGLLAMACGLVARGRDQLAAAGVSGDPAIILAGGDAEVLASRLEGAKVEPELVLDGLSLALMLEDS